MGMWHVHQCMAGNMTPDLVGLRWLLAATTVAGLVCGIAYSASYQMVSRFAKKNTISLGLGCVGSGIIVLFLELGLQLGIHPTKLQSILLYEFTAGERATSVSLATF